MKFGINFYIFVEMHSFFKFNYEYIMTKQNNENIVPSFPNALSFSPPDEPKYFKKIKLEKNVLRVRLHEK
jgi:hypothetical protein